MNGVAPSLISHVADALASPDQGVRSEHGYDGASCLEPWLIEDQATQNSIRLPKIIDDMCLAYSPRANVVRDDQNRAPA
jgi:hypothetical protein